MTLVTEAEIASFVRASGARLVLLTLASMCRWG
jgi:hypothetical protein